MKETKLCVHQWDLIIPAMAMFSYENALSIPFQLDFGGCWASEDGLPHVQVGPG